MDHRRIRFYINRNADVLMWSNFFTINSLQSFDTNAPRRLNTGFPFQPRAEGGHKCVRFLGLGHISTVTAGGKKRAGEWCDKAAACQVIGYQGGESHRHAYAVKCGLQCEIEMVERQRRGWFEISNARSGEPVAP